MNLLKICNKIIEYSFYALFLLVPLTFTSATSELFELNKMWLTWGLTIIIGTSWFAEMILQRRILLCRTPLDIPIGLFLLSQIISTIFSQDVHVSLWGYYSRFNGGLLSIFSYVFLYYAFVSNFKIDSANKPHEKYESIRDFCKIHATTMVKRLLFVSLISGTIVALWGLPSHFGYDPTCLLFRGTLDVSCWTADFIPRARIFSTLGQPAWLAAYLAILIPITIALILTISQNHRRPSIYLIYLVPLTLLILFYVDLLYTSARSGFLGIWIALFFFAIYIFTAIRDKKPFGLAQRGREIRKNLLLISGLLLLITFIIGAPIGQLNRFTLEGIKSYFQKPAITETQKRIETHNDVKSPESAEPARNASQSVAGGTESADIRLNVWTGAINAWKANPLFGTGVETFAFAYYKYKPAVHNLTSEWNFLYNKAHNEYLNYLTTTGAFGLITYLTMIGSFIFITIKDLRLKIKDLGNEKNHQSSIFNHQSSLLILALLASYISILITNFFGFSVVITNIYLFMIPAFVFILGGILNPEKQFAFPKNESGIKNYESRNLYEWTFIFFIILASLFMLSNLIRFWQADIVYALGYNLDRAGEYQKAYESLNKAVELRGDEPVFKDELSINNAIIAAGLLAQRGDQDQSAKDQTIALGSALAQKAINTSNEIVSQYQHNAVFWKTRTRVFYTLSQVDSRYLPRALDAIEKGSLLAPNDANIWYNLGVLYGQNGKLEKGIHALEKTVKLKPDYRDAHYALGLYYHALAMDEKDKVVIDSALQKKAIAQMQYILDHLNRQDASVMNSLKDWKQ